MAGAAEITGFDIELDDRTLIVSGSLDSGATVGVTVCDSNGNLVYMNDAKLTDDNADFTFNMNITSKVSETYTVAFSGNGVELISEKVDFVVSGENEFLNFSVGGNRGIIKGNTVKVEVSENSLKNLVASFAVSDKATVWVDDVLQESGVTKNDFTSDVVYTVIAEDGSKREYTVEVTRKKESSKGSGGGGGSSSKSPSLSPFVAVVPDETEKAPEVAIPSEKFTDLSGSEWAKEWIYYLYGQGIVSGVTDSTFEPERSVKREEFVKMVVIALGENPKAGDSAFEDVSSEQWYAGYINTAVEKGIVNGVSDTQFGVGKEITREDMAVMLYRAFGKDAFESGINDVVFADESEISDYAKEAVEAMAKSGIITGKDGGTFDPKASASRAEAATVIGRLMSRK